MITTRYISFGMVLKVIMAKIARSNVSSISNQQKAWVEYRSSDAFFCWNEILGMLKYSEMLFMAIARIGEEIIEML